MQTLDRAMLAHPNIGEALPSPFGTFDIFGIKHRKGQVSLVASASGGGKSAYATHVAVHSHPRIPTVYFSADTDPHTLGVRVAASVLNESLVIVEKLLGQHDQSVWKTVQDGTGHVWWHWNPTPSCQDVQDEVEAYAIENGRWPSLIVVDNLINVDTEGDRGWQATDGIMSWLGQLATYTQAHVMVLHHVTKEYVDGVTPIPKSGLLDAVDKRPRLILTMYRIDENLVGVRVVKNSFGKADPEAGWGPDIGVMFDRAWMEAVAV